MINTVLFDLDGTLLSMDTDLFIKKYFGYVAHALKDYLTQDEVVKLFWASTNEVINSVDGTKTNAEVFFENFFSKVDIPKETLLPILDEFYATDFNQLKELSESKKEMIESIKILKEKGYDVILSTNPIFPEVAIHNRVEWANLDKDDFVYITTFENSYYTKPNINYYVNILKDNNKKAEECLMVGNHVDEDMIAHEIGIETYLILDHMMGDPTGSTNIDHRGNYPDFLEYVKGLPQL